MLQVFRSARLIPAAVVLVMLAPAVRAADVAASAPIAASAPLMFRQDEPTGFPVGGAVLLASLLVIAGVTWWLRRHSVPSGMLNGIVRQRGAPPDVLSVTSSHRLDAQTRLYVVRWKGRDLLVASGGPTGPVVLDRADAATPEQAP